LLEVAAIGLMSVVVVVCVCVLAGRVERSEGGTGEVWFSGIGEGVGVRVGDVMIRNLHWKHFCKKKKKKKRVS